MAKTMHKSATNAVATNINSDTVASNEATAETANEVIRAASKTINDALAALPSANLADVGHVTTDDLNNIDFSKIIGGPLQAAVDAQVASSIATINFIKSVGFNQDETVKMVNFKYNKTDSEGKKIGADIEIPLLAMLPIPSLRIEYVDITFNAKLNSVQTTEVKDDLKVGLEGQVNYGVVALKVTASYQRSTTAGFKVEKEYTLNVKVRAVQDEIPAGLEKILNLLAGS